MNRGAKKKVCIKSDSKVEVPKRTQCRHNKRTCAKHRVNVNVDIVSHCKHEKKNDDACTAKANRSASGSTSMIGVYGKRCSPEVFKTASKADDCSNVM